MAWLGDFHIHSNFSDGQLSIAEVIDLYGGLGFGAIAITDHLCESETFLGRSARWMNRTLTEKTFPIYIEQIQEQAERALKMYNMVVIPGFEVTKNSIFNHRSAHILALGLEQFVSADQEPLAIARQIRALGGLAVAAHPVHTGALEPQTYHLWSRRDEWAGEFDAWEVASGPVFSEEVLHSGLPLLASSDLHRTEQINSWKTQLQCRRHPQAILAAIRRQQVEFKKFQVPFRKMAKSCH